MQQKTGRPVQFEITESTRDAISDWVAHFGATGSDFLFPSRVSSSPHISTRQYTRLVEGWELKSGCQILGWIAGCMARTRSVGPSPH